MKVKASIVPLVFVFTLISGDANEDSEVTQTPQLQFDQWNRSFYSCKFNFLVRCVWKHNGNDINIYDYDYTWKVGNGYNAYDCSIQAKHSYTRKLSDAITGATVECIGIRNVNPPRTVPSDPRDSRVTQTPQLKFDHSRDRASYSCQFNFLVRCLWKQNDNIVDISEYGYTWKIGNGSDTNDCSIEAKSQNPRKLSDDSTGTKVECLGIGSGPRKVTLGDSIVLQCPVTNREQCRWTRGTQRLPMNNKYSYIGENDCSIRINPIRLVDLKPWNCYDMTRPQRPRSIYTLVEQNLTDTGTLSKKGRISSKTMTTSTTPTTTTTEIGAISSTVTTSTTTTTDSIAKIPDTVPSKVKSPDRDTAKVNTPYKSTTKVETFETDTTDLTTIIPYINITSSTNTINGIVTVYANLTTNSLNPSSANSNDDQSMTLTVIVVVAVVVTCAIAFVMATVIYYLRRRKNLKEKRPAPDEPKYNPISFNAKSEDIRCPGSISESNYMTLSGPFAPPSQKTTSNRPPPRNTNNVDQSNDAIYADVIIGPRSPTASCPVEVPRNNADDVTYADVIIRPRSPDASRPVEAPRNNVDDVTYADVIIGQRSPTASRAVPHNNVGDVTYAVVMPKRH